MTESFNIGKIGVGTEVDLTGIKKGLDESVAIANLATKRMQEIFSELAGPAQVEPPAPPDFQAQIQAINTYKASMTQLASEVAGGSIGLSEYADEAARLTQEVNEAHPASRLLAQAYAQMESRIKAVLPAEERYAQELREIALALDQGIIPSQREANLLIDDAKSRYDAVNPAVQAYNADLRTAQKLVDANRSAKERYNIAIIEAKRLLDQGIIGQQTYGRELERQKGILKSATQDKQRDAEMARKQAQALEMVDTVIMRYGTDQDKAALSTRRHTQAVEMLDIQLKDGWISQEAYNMAVQDSARVSDLFNRQMGAGKNSAGKMSSMMQQLSFGAQDFIQVFGQTGVSGALRASANNMAQVAAIAGGVNGALVGLGVTAASIAVATIFENLPKEASKGEEAINRVERALQDLKRTLDEIEKRQDIKFRIEDLVKEGNTKAIDKRLEELKRQQETAGIKIDESRSGFIGAIMQEMTKGTAESEALIRKFFENSGLEMPTKQVQVRSGSTRVEMRSAADIEAARQLAMESVASGNIGGLTGVGIEAAIGKGELLDKFNKFRKQEAEFAKEFGDIAEEIDKLKASRPDARANEADEAGKKFRENVDQAWRDFQKGVLKAGERLAKDQQKKNEAADKALRGAQQDLLGDNRFEKIGQVAEEAKNRIAAINESFMLPEDKASARQTIIAAAQQELDEIKKGKKPKGFEFSGIKEFGDSIQKGLGGDAMLTEAQKTNKLFDETLKVQKQQLEELKKDKAPVAG